MITVSLFFLCFFQLELFPHAKIPRLGLLKQIVLFLTLKLCTPPPVSELPSAVVPLVIHLASFSSFPFTASSSHARITAVFFS